MPGANGTKPVGDTVSKVNDEIAVGSDLGFQRRWWRIETVLWVLLAALLVLDVLGCFGRGYLANAHRASSDGSLEVKYECIARFGTPSKMTVQFGPGAVRDNKVALWTSESLVRDLGNQRILPQPSSSVPGHGGIVHVFPVSGFPASVVFDLEPASPGSHSVTLRASGREELRLNIFVMP